MKIYKVTMRTDDYFEYKLFATKDKAEEYLSNKRIEEDNNRYMRNICKDCTNPDKKCPYYVESIYKDDICDNRMYAWYEDQNYQIEEVEVVE